MKRLLFVALVCGLVTVPSLGAPSLGFWQEGDPGSMHMVWNFESDHVIQTISGDKDSFDADTSEAASFPSGVVHTPLGIAVINGVNVTYDSQNGTFSSPNPLDVHLKMNNFPNPNAFKEIWINILTDGPSVWERTGIAATDGGVTSFTYEPLSKTGPEGGDLLGWRIRPNPFFEEVEFSLSPAAAGEIVTLSALHADTICTPAPGALLLASLGASVVGWLRARRSI